MIDRWIAGLTNKQAIIVLVITLIIIGVLASGIAALAGVPLLQSALIGLSTIGLVCLWFAIRFIVLVIVKIRQHR